jgi:hypothetical protein
MVAGRSGDNEAGRNKKDSKRAWERWQIICYFLYGKEINNYNVTFSRILFTTLSSLHHSSFILPPLPRLSSLHSYLILEL